MILLHWLLRLGNNCTRFCLISQLFFIYPLIRTQTCFTYQYILRKSRELLSKLYTECLSVSRRANMPLIHLAEPFFTRPICYRKTCRQEQPKYLPVNSCLSKYETGFSCRRSVHQYSSGHTNHEGGDFMLSVHTLPHLQSCHLYGKRSIRSTKF